MTVRDRAFYQVLTWLENDKEGDEPQPPEGMHPLATAEWQAGAAAAQKDFDESDAAWQDLEDFIVYGIKTTIIVSLASTAFWWHNPWGLLAADVVIAALLWRWL